MITPFDRMVEEIRRNGYHNHRKEEHSNTVAQGIYDDLVERCDVLKEDANAGKVGRWLNVSAPGARGRKIDLLVGEPGKDGEPDLTKIRICVENKSVITAHRNRDARFDDLNQILETVHRVSPEAVLVATVVVGIADKVLNVPDRIKPFRDDFDQAILPRLSTGDQSLWTEFGKAVSPNRRDDPQKTVEKFRKLPVRPPGYTHVLGYDFVLTVPVFIDNVNPPSVSRVNNLGIDVDADYLNMINQVCKAYRSRWQ